MRRQDERRQWDCIAGVGAAQGEQAALSAGRPAVLFAGLLAGLLTGLLGGLPAQQPAQQRAQQRAQQPGTAAGPEPSRSLEDLLSQDPVVRDLARRRLAVRATLPETELRVLLRHEQAGTAFAAATLLRDRRLGLPDLRAIPRADTDAFGAVLPLQSDEVVTQTLREGPERFRVPAFWLAVDRGLVTEDQLVALLRGGADDGAVDLAEAACRWVVLERVPFPVQVARRLDGDRPAKIRLLGWLAERPRNQAGAWVESILRDETLSLLERVLAISALPPEQVDLARARVVVEAAVGQDLAASNRATIAAARFRPELADALVPELKARVADGAPASNVLPCLERVSKAGEDQILAYGLTAESAVQTDIFHWLSVRESTRVDRYVEMALDGPGPFPPGLIRLADRVLTTKSRIDRIAAFLADEEGAGGAQADGKHAAVAFSALIDGKVYHPAMLGYADRNEDRARAYAKLLGLPWAKLPEAVFLAAIDTDDLSICTYAANSASRGPIPAKVQSLLADFANHSLHAPLRVSAARALLLFGGEKEGRAAWAAMRTAGQTALALTWLMERPKPWSYEILLRERERLATLPDQEQSLHRVLIALAKLRDRGAREQLLKAVSRLRPEELRQLESLVGQVLDKSDLEALAGKHLTLRRADPTVEDEDQFEEEDERRGELLEWFLKRPEIDLSPRLSDLWQHDASYEIRLLALRGLLQRGDPQFLATVRKRLAAGAGEAEQELAFEVVGSMQLPLSPANRELVAEIVLRLPLRAPRAEVAHALADFSSSRGRYPLLTPVVNLLRRGREAEAGPAFARVAEGIEAASYALNRQRLGLFLIGLGRQPELLDAVGPSISALILKAPDLATEFVGPAEVVLGRAAEKAGEFGRAASLFRRASRAFTRAVVPEFVQRAFLGATDTIHGYHPLAALAAREPLCLAKAALRAGDLQLAQRQLDRALVRAEGDEATRREIEELKRRSRGKAPADPAPTRKSK